VDREAEPGAARRHRHRPRRDRYYKRAVTIMDVEQLGGTIIEQLAE
jgi:hypothetical protein